ncbi:MAG: hypothetical protein B6242_04915 [Anaerolineaceae bacterium 4572_78]|nr:MAG: hypothetical protein B6242_04915 [Anaerolineaceae bacterium 4572_78]
MSILHNTKPYITTTRHAYDVFSGTYDDTYQSPSELAQNHVIFSLIKQAQCHQPPILDLGCGTGLFLEIISLKQKEYVGVDISGGMLQIARRKFPHNTFFQADMTNLHFLPSQSFQSIVILFDGFTHIINPKTVVMEVYRLLKPSGHFFVMTLSKRFSRTPIIARELNMIIPHRLWDANSLRNEFDIFDNVQVKGMHVIPHWWFNDLPYMFMYLYLLCEITLISSYLPDWGHYMIITGSKPKFI